MGCNSSSTASVSNEPNGDNSSPRGVFTELQIDSIRSTWPIIKKDMEKNGCAMFLLIFTSSPRIKQLFPFRDLSDEDLINDITFQSHAKRFMTTIDSMTEELEDPDAKCGPELVLIGAKHGAFEGFEASDLAVFSKSLHVQWEMVMGEEYTEDIRESWTILFDYIVNKIREGYWMFIDNRDNEAGIADN